MKETAGHDDTPFPLPYGTVLGFAHKAGGRTDPVKGEIESTA